MYKQQSIHNNASTLIPSSLSLSTDFLALHYFPHRSVISCWLLQVHHWSSNTWLTWNYFGYKLHVFKAPWDHYGIHARRQINKIYRHPSKSLTSHVGCTDSPQLVWKSTIQQITINLTEISLSMLLKIISYY